MKNNILIALFSLNIVFIACSNRTEEEYYWDYSDTEFQEGDTVYLFDEESIQSNVDILFIPELVVLFDAYEYGFESIYLKPNKPVNISSNTVYYLVHKDSIVEGLLTKHLVKVIHSHTFYDNDDVITQFIFDVDKPNKYNYINE